MTVKSAGVTRAAPPETNGVPVTLTYTNAQAHAVFVAGNFNDWNKTSHPLRADGHGVWTCTLHLSAGVYNGYKFIVDGQWQPDPANTEKANDGFGGYNSVVFVPPSTPVDTADPTFLPATEHHDAAQRVFVVESARVLAWYWNRAEPKVGEVRYEVHQEADGKWRWVVRWLDHGGATWRTATVVYPTELLDEGATFYREVFRQLAGKYLSAPVGKPAILLGDAYWRGADQAGSRRLAGVLQATKLTVAPAEHLPPDRMAEIGGLLTHAALPGLAGMLTLDAQLLARGAAWLCLAETQSGAPADDLLWAPALFLAGRERAANYLWQGHEPPHSAAAEWWALLSRQPTAQQAFTFGAEETHRRQAVPFLAYCAQLDVDDVAVLARVLPAYASQPAEFLNECYEMAPFLVGSGGVAAGHETAAAGFIARQDWLKALTALGKLLPGETNQLASVETAQRAEQAPDEDVGDPRLIGFKEALPVIRLGSPFRARLDAGGQRECRGFAPVRLGNERRPTSVAVLLSRNDAGRTGIRQTLCRNGAQGAPGNGAVL